MQSYGQCRVPNQLLMRFCDGSDAGLLGSPLGCVTQNRAMDKIILQTRQEHQEK